jgi:hypothetical protein
MLPTLLALFPMAVLLLPVVLLYKALVPNAELLLPVVFNYKAPFPTAEF